MAKRRVHLSAGFGQGPIAVDQAQARRLSHRSHEPDMHCEGAGLSAHIRDWLSGCDTLSAQYGTSTTSVIRSSGVGGLYITRTHSFQLEIAHERPDPDHV